MSGPPTARVEPVVETLWGEIVADPYRWMEAADGDPEWRSFMTGQGAWARQVLDALPERAEIAARVAALSGDAAAAGAVRRAGGRVFYELREVGAEGFALSVADTLGADGSLLFDPAAESHDGVHVSLDWWVPSPDGAYVAIGVSSAGSERSELRVLDVGTGEALRERIDRTPYARLNWLPDGAGFFYNRLQDAPWGSVESRQDSICRLHRLGTDPESDPVILGRGLDPRISLTPDEQPSVFFDRSATHALALITEGVRHELRLYAAPMAAVVAGEPVWRPVCEVADEVTDFAVFGDVLYLLTTAGAENGRVLACSLGGGDVRSARVVAREDTTVVDSIACSRDALWLRGIDGGYGVLRRRPHPGGPVETIPLPYSGSIAGLYATTAEDGALAALTGWLEPRRLWGVGADGMADQRWPVPPAIDTSPYTVTRTVATVRDGTRVPVSIIARRERDGPAPALVTAYGAYQSVSGPIFNPRAFAFLQRGGVLATVHVRGGGEFGRGWWRAGKGATKPNSWRDLIDGCEHLIAGGWTTTDRLVIRGGSAGGITAGRALTERPDLFAGAVIAVGVLNTLRAEFAPNGPPNIPEYGTIADEAGFRALRAMDALQAVEDGVHYPAVLLTHGMTDGRVEPWMSAKFAARLQAATASEAAVLLRVTEDAGHGIGSTRTQLDQELADVYAFVLACASGDLLAAQASVRVAE